MNHSLEKICTQVQNNCHIADARHAADYTMCAYLLKMREYYRWELGYGFTDALPKDPLGAWLEEREALWEMVEQADYSPIEISGKTFDPFDTNGINQALEPFSLVYSAGLGLGGRAHFYLAELLHKQAQDDVFTLYVSGKEYARCLTAPPAMASGHDVFLRKEALQRYLWEKYESWLWSRPDNALGRAFSHYDFATDPQAAVETMAATEMDAAKEHELGEYQAGLLLGEQWNQLVLDMALSPAELMARAVKDHLADALRTLPMLLQQRAVASWHFYVGNLNGMRKHLFPELVQAYQQWHETGDWTVLEAVVATAANKWQTLAQEMLKVHQRLGVGAAETLRRKVLNKCGLEE